MKKLLLCLLLLPSLGFGQSLYEYTNLSKYRVRVGELVLNGEKIRPVASDSGQVLQFDGTRWKNTTKNGESDPFYKIDSLALNRSMRAFVRDSGNYAWLKDTVTIIGTKKDLSLKQNTLVNPLVQADTATIKLDTNQVKHLQTFVENHSINIELDAKYCNTDSTDLKRTMRAFVRDSGNYVWWIDTTKTTGAGIASRFDNSLKKDNSDSTAVTGYANRGRTTQLLSLKQNLLVNSAGLAGALNDETGTLKAVFSDSPTLTGNNKRHNSSFFISYFLRINH